MGFELELDLVQRSVPYDESEGVWPPELLLEIAAVVSNPPKASSIGKAPTSIIDLNTAGGEPVKAQDDQEDQGTGLEPPRLLRLRHDGLDALPDTRLSCRSESARFFKRISRVLDGGQ
jgi:hypothetical protein